MHEIPTLHVGPHDIRCLVSAADTGERVSVLEIISPPGEGVGPHVHTSEDETFHVLDGVVQVTTGGQTHRLTPGRTLLAPRRTPHAFVNIGDGPSRMLLIVTPGGLEQFFEDCHRQLPRSAPFDIALFTTIAARHGMKLLD